MSKANNFDLIRLAAAIQVAVTHSMDSLGVGESARWFRSVVDLFPGVPVFFFISGFLISKSFEKNSVLQEYALNRILRIYPGLFACFAAALVMVWASGYFATVRVPATDFLLWTAAQLSFVQFYNPPFMRQYGLGVLNGSLWTIAVELQFYVLVPAMYWALRLRRAPKRQSNRLLLLVAAAFLLINQVYVNIAPAHSQALWYKIVGVSFAPWFYMFLIGVLFQRNFEMLHAWLAGRFVALLAFYCGLAFIAIHFLGWGLGDRLNPVLFAGLAVLAFSAAFSRNTLSDRLLRRNDLSYGVYIYHAPVINFLLAVGFAGTGWSLSVVLAVTLVLAYLSWRWVEKPALGFKRHPLYQHASASGGS